MSSTKTYAPRTGCTLLSSPINTPHPLAHFTLNSSVNRVRPCVSVLCKICEFKATRMEILEVSLQRGNALKPNLFLRPYLAYVLFIVSLVRSL